MDDRFATQLSEAPLGLGGESAHAPAQTRYLILLSGGIPGTMIPLRAGPVTLGRSESNGFVLPEPSISRRHAIVRLDEEGAWMIDQASTNGTYRNGLRLPPYLPTRLRDHDRIRLGARVVLKFACPDPEEEQFQKAMFERTVRDSLTGLFNRSYYLDRLREVAARASERGLGLAVIMLDIDHFKAINDRLGHDGGDVVLRGVAALVRQATRPEDLVARFGGEEFAIALPIASAAMAAERAEAIRLLLASTPIPFRKRDIRVTASLGVAFAPCPVERHFDAMIAEADRSLYLAKSAGRDRAVLGRGDDGDTPMSVAVFGR